MKNLYRAVIFAFLVILLTSCSAFAPKPTLTPTPTATSLPTSTPTLVPTPTDTPTPVPTDTATSTPTQELNYYFAPDNFYSLVPPEGWVSKDIGMKDPALLGPKAGGFTVNMNFIRDKNDFGWEMYSAFVQDDLMAKLPGLTAISEDFLQTKDLTGYLRWEITDTQQGVLLRQVFYFFGKGSDMLVITYTRPDGAGAEYDAAVDKSISTFRFN